LTKYGAQAQSYVIEKETLKSTNFESSYSRFTHFTFFI